MSADLDRFDRMLLAAEQSRSLVAPSPSPSEPPIFYRPRQPRRVNLKRRPQQKADRAPVITSERGPRFVDYMPCPMCGYHRIGIEFHGVLMSGAKVHQLYSHSHGSGMRHNGKPKCLGAGMRVVFLGGVWRGAPA